MINREKARERAKGLVEQMTVEEMVSQLKFDAPAIERLNIPAYNWWNEGLHSFVPHGRGGGFGGQSQVQCEQSPWGPGHL